MDSAVAASIISSLAALGIAVGGNIVNGKSQAKATTTAHASALDLFKTQREAQALAQKEQPSKPGGWRTRTRGWTCTCDSPAS